MDSTRKYSFSWDLLGNVQQGRPNLGQNLRVEAYRLMQFCVRDVVEQEFGAEAGERLFRRAGYLAGKELYHNVLSGTEDLNGFVKKMQSVLRDLGIGVLRMEETDLDNGRLVITVAEDLECSGLPETGHQMCTYDEGFIAALLDSFTGEKFDVREVDCWCTGYRTCRFVAQMTE